MRRSRGIVVFDKLHRDVFSRCQRSLFGYAYALTRDAERAADLLQDCVVRAMSTRYPPRDARAVRSWLFAILRNLWIDELRAERRRDRAHHEIAAEEAHSAATFPELNIVNRMAVRQAFDQLGKDHRDVLALVDIGGFAYQEAADILGVPRGTVMSRVSRARLALARTLADTNVVELDPENRRRGWRGAR